MNEKINLILTVCTSWASQAVLQATENHILILLNIGIATITIVKLVKPKEKK